MSRKNIFVIALDDFNLAQLRMIRNADQYQFHGLIPFHELVGPRHYAIRYIYENALRQLHDFPGSVDAIVGYWDFPTSTMLPLLRRAFHLPGPSFESVLRCEHKYWARLCQREAVPECTPDFAIFDPLDDHALSKLNLDFPVWIKPVKAMSSHLGFFVDDEQSFHEAVQIIRHHIARIAIPFNWLLQYGRLPAEIADTGGRFCIAEQIISAEHQCTLEGYVYESDVVVYGIVDSIREGAAQSSFARYQYPSQLPMNVQQRMIDITRRVLRHIEYDHAPFNIEFYYDPAADRISLLEINTRISKSHCPMFQMVTGASHQEVMVDVALGRQPDYPRDDGPFDCAAKFMVRKYEDAMVRRVPTEAEVQAVQEAIPGTLIQIEVTEGIRLSELRNQDSYSYEIAAIFIGGRDEADLLNKYDQCLERLNFCFGP